MSEVSTGNEDDKDDDYIHLSNEEMIDGFSQYRSERYHPAKNTRRTYNESINAFGAWLRDYRDGKELIDVVGQDILDYRTHLCTRDIRNGTIYIRIVPINYIYRWAVKVGILKVNPFPEMVLERATPHTAVIPKVNDILKARSGGGATSLRDAAIFEMLLSSGLRTSELIQVRCCDIDFNPKTMDHELGRASPFIGGKIDMSGGSGIHIKSIGTSALRVTWISKLAAILVKALMKQCGLSEHDNLPIFPLDRFGVKNAIRNRVGNGLYELSVSKKMVRRKAGFRDIDISKSNVSEEYKRQVMEAQEKQRKEEEEDRFVEREDRIERQRSQNLHPHALRHFFGVWQYYRNYVGGRRDILAVRDMMGHKTVEMTDLYVTGEVYVENDFQWKQVALGNGSDYMRFLRG